MSVTADPILGNLPPDTLSPEPLPAAVESAPLAERIGTLATVNPWHQRAAELAAWSARYFVRADRYGGYFIDDNGKTQTCTKPQKPRAKAVTNKLLERHFKATKTNDVVGVHTLSAVHGGGRYAALDINAHPGAKADPDANFRMALASYAKAEAVGLIPLLYESNGKGGYHFVVFFSGEKPYVPGPVLYGFGKWLAADYATAGLKKAPETYPKQRTIPADGYGNWLRVIGRHHTRDFWPRVWDGSAWLDGAAAVVHVLSIPQSDPDLIPHEARALVLSKLTVARRVRRLAPQQSDRGTTSTTEVTQARCFNVTVGRCFASGVTVSQSGPGRARIRAAPGRWAFATRAASRSSTSGPTGLRRWKRTRRTAHTLCSRPSTTAGTSRRRLRTFGVRTSAGRTIKHRSRPRRAATTR